MTPVTEEYEQSSATYWQCHYEQIIDTVTKEIIHF